MPSETVSGRAPCQRRTLRQRGRHRGASVFVRSRGQREQRLESRHDVGQGRCLLGGWVRLSAFRLNEARPADNLRSAARRQDADVVFRGRLIVPTPSYSRRCRSVPRTFGHCSAAPLAVSAPPRRAWCAVRAASPLAEHGVLAGLHERRTSSRMLHVTAAQLPHRAVACSARLRLSQRAHVAMFAPARTPRRRAAPLRGFFARGDPAAVTVLYSPRSRAPPTSIVDRQRALAGDVVAGVSAAFVCIPQARATASRPRGPRAPAAPRAAHGELGRKQSLKLRLAQAQACARLGAI
jgi:hypothetical protein